MDVENQHHVPQHHASPPQQRPPIHSRTSASKTTSKSQFHKTCHKAQKIHRPAAAKSRNPYLNFLREFRKRNVGLSGVDQIRRGAQEWRALSRDKKLKYIEAAYYAPKKYRRMAKQASVCSVASVPSDCGCKVKRKRRGCRKKRRKSKCGRRRRVKKRRGCKKRRRRKRC